MTTHIALLRAVNLGPHNKVGMADLRELCDGLGLANTRSLLQSGNLVFEADRQSTAELETLLERAAKKRLGLDTALFVRTAAEWRTVVTGNPFEDEAERDPGHLVVFVMRDAPSRDQVAALEGAIVGRERVRAKGKHAYLVYPDGIGRSRATSALIERKLGSSGTMRNWNTVLKLGALAHG